MQADAQLRRGARSVCWLVAVPGGGDQMMSIGTCRSDGVDGVVGPLVVRSCSVDLGGAHGEPALAHAGAASARAREGRSRAPTTRRSERQAEDWITQSRRIVRGNGSR